jgi:hypothetical protein
VALEVNPNVCYRESKVDITIQPRYLFSPEAYDNPVFGRSNVTTLLDVQSYTIRGRPSNDDVEQPLNLG